MIARSAEIDLLICHPTSFLKLNQNEIEGENENLRRNDSDVLTSALRHMLGLPVWE